MSENNLKFPLVTDLELLDQIFLYLNVLCSHLPSLLLQHHCKGAIASIYELLSYLESHNLKVYGNYEK